MFHLTWCENSQDVCVGAKDIGYKTLVRRRLYNGKKLMSQEQQ